MIWTEDERQAMASAAQALGGLPTMLLYGRWEPRDDEVMGLVLYQVAPGLCDVLGDYQLAEEAAR